MASTSADAGPSDLSRKRSRPLDDLVIEQGGSNGRIASASSSPSGTPTKSKFKKQNKTSNGFANGPQARLASNGNGYQLKPDDAITEGRKRLPIWSAKDAIVEQIQQHETVILMADTGSGKSTRE